MHKPNQTSAENLQLRNWPHQDHCVMCNRPSRLKSALGGWKRLTKAVTLQWGGHIYNLEHMERKK